jgi:hypothetical protein
MSIDGWEVQVRQLIVSEFVYQISGSKQIQVHLAHELSAY